MPELHTWHKVYLPAEFTAADAGPGSTLQAYLAREQRLFQELRDMVSATVERTEKNLLSRYLEGGMQDPNWRSANWNRTFEMVPDQIRGGALLLHGLTDSPYSLRRVGEILRSRGFYVLGLRLPGHGTVPAALTRIKWEDWVAAVRIGAQHVSQRIEPDRPFVVAGYSNGGGLALKYTLDALEDPALRPPDRLLLFSPEVGITPLAAIANAHEILSFLPYFEKFRWLSIAPEYDPFKYNSFPKNAAQQAYEVTTTLERQIRTARDTNRLAKLPPLLTFLSWTDATVKTSATIRRLYDQLPNNGSELVIFDVNRFDPLKPMLPASIDSSLDALSKRSDLPYRLSIVTNLTDETETIGVRSRPPFSNHGELRALPLVWPRGVYSLAHVAIPFPPEDPVYGTGQSDSESYRGLALGALRPRGETDVLTVSLSQLMRLRHNPFFGYVHERVALELDSLLKNSRKAPSAQRD
jgi:alpha-beta hydrolase superfamily lysophospholipase